MFNQMAAFAVSWGLSFLAQAQPDFKLPNPDEKTVPAPVQHALSTILPPADTGPGTTQILLGAGAAVVAVVLFYFLRGALFTHLIEKRAAPSSARAASWAFFVFLTATAWTAIAGFVVGLWSSIPFLAGGGVVTLATLIFFLV